MEASNVKAMREALEIAKKAICNYARHTCDSLAWENSTINANCGDILCVHRDLCKAKTAIQKALAAPPRNCDVGTAETRMYRYDRLLDEINERYKQLGEIPPAFAFPTAFEWEDRPYEEGDEK